MEELAFLLKQVHFHAARNGVISFLQNFLLVLGLCVQFLEEVSFVLTSILCNDLLRHSESFLLDSLESAISVIDLEEGVVQELLLLGVLGIV